MAKRRPRPVLPDLQTFLELPDENLLDRGQVTRAIDEARRRVVAWMVENRYSKAEVDVALATLPDGDMLFEELRSQGRVLPAVDDDTVIH